MESAVAYVLFESADSTWLLFLSRFVQGFGGGTVGVVQAYLSDSVAKKDRAKAFGWLTAATSAGVMVGPAIGSLAASYGTIGPGYLASIGATLLRGRELERQDYATDPDVVVVNHHLLLADLALPGRGYVTHNRDGCVSDPNDTQRSCEDRSGAAIATACSQTRPQP